MKVKIKRLNSEVKLPNYANPGDAGMDFFSAENVIINSGERKTVKTGISMAIPVGFVGLFWDKSGLASKKGIKTMAGVIDSGFRGEIGIVLKNLGDDEFVIEKNMKIAQMLIQPIYSPELEEVESLEETERGQGGFGSTGQF
ncbi:dUTP diphosphatase [archaeon]|jgi:dUTP pyrophosphatase|nr:dUTP diphosphatase [archaeon]MBT3450453.1 dUTP diphosphatase [archaeon]MBT6868990.1 dUTP diphosphatase [archaeon]MBT7193256.1 dUTP diphosphatase [archaeon]MBT7380111.1 dUTP diphosphatase [archaeon]